MPNIWFPFNIGKYLQDAGQLSMGEHGAYLTLMLHYYGTSEPIPEDRKYVIARAITQQDTQQVNYILQRYFKLKDGYWIHNEIERTLESIKNRADNSRNNGMKGGRPKTQQDTQQVISGFGLANPDPNQLQEHLKLQKEKHLKDVEGGQGGGFDILKFLKNGSYEDAKLAAPGWDISILANAFNKNINTGKFEWPRKPENAFIAWCPIYTKGKRPQ